MNQDLCCLSHSEPAFTALKLHQKPATGKLEWYNTARQLQYLEFPLHMKCIIKNLKQEMGYPVKFQMMLLSGITSAHARIHRLPSSPGNQFNCVKLLFTEFLLVKVQTFTLCSTLLSVGYFSKRPLSPRS